MTYEMLKGVSGLVSEKKLIWSGFVTSAAVERERLVPPEIENGSWSAWSKCGGKNTSDARF